MNRTKTLKFLLILLAVGFLGASCGSSKKGCDGRKKTRVEMGWM